MTYCLVKAITEDLQTLEWFVVKNLTTNLSTGKARRGSQQEFLAVAKKSNNVVGLLPSYEVRFQEIKLPKIVKSKLIRAIPYALEEYLAEDIEKMHFALLGTDKEQTKNNMRVVAYTSKIIIAKWYALFKQVHESSYLISQIQLLPWQRGEWTLCVGEKKFWLRETVYSGICLEKEYLSSVLSGLIKEKIQDQFLRIIPVGIQDLTAVQELLKQHRCKFKIESNVNNIWEICDLSGLKLQNINLLQGEFSLASETEQTKKIWTYALSILCVGIIAATSLKLFLFYDLQNKQQEIDTQTLVSYKRVAPKATSLQPAQQSLMNLLQSSQAESSEKFLILLGGLGEARMKLSALKVNSVSYAQQQLKVDINVSKYSGYTQLQKILKQSGFVIKTISATTENNQAHVVFSMTAGI